MTKEDALDEFIKREQALQALAALSQKMGLYDALPIRMAGDEAPSAYILPEPDYRIAAGDTPSYEPYFDAWGAAQMQAAYAAGRAAPKKLTDDQIAAHGFTASQMMARDQTRFDAACEVMRYLRESNAPYYYLHRMSIVLHGNTEGTNKSREPDKDPLK